MRIVSVSVAAVIGGLFFLLSACSSAVTVVPTPTGSAEGGATIPPNTVVPAETDSPAQAALVTSVPTPTPSPTVTPTPLIPALPIPEPAGPPYTYHTIAEGETLSYIAMRYDSSIEEITEMNDLSGEAAIIFAGQSLRVPLQTGQTAPEQMLMPDSEVVYSPAYLDFDIETFINSQNGYLADYRQWVDNEELTGPQIVERIAEQFSVGPRLLLALLEYYGEWVTNPSPPQELIDQPLGPLNRYGGDLYRGLGFTANRVNAGYYGYKRDGFWVYELANWEQAITPTGLNAGTVGVQNILAVHAADWESWLEQLQPEGFMATYRALFGDPFQYTFEPVVPITLTQPQLTLPWRSGDQFYFTGGPHAAYADGSGWAAIDFGPPDVLGNCYYSDVPSTAAADGVIVTARQGEVNIDLDGDGQIQTGWGLFYLHIVLDIDTPVQVGQQVKAGDVVGYASCEGGLATSSHLHFARRYNGEWIEAGGPVPMDLDGWVVQPNLIPYSGNIARGDEVRESCECWDPELNLMVKP